MDSSGVWSKKVTAKRQKDLQMEKRASATQKVIAGLRSRDADQIDTYFREKAKSNMTSVQRSPRQNPRYRHVSTPSMLIR